MYYVHWRTHDTNAVTFSSLEAEDQCEGEDGQGQERTATDYTANNDVQGICNGLDIEYITTQLVLYMYMYFFVSLCSMGIPPVLSAS